MILSAVATVTSIADGSRLKCIIGARLPAMAESIMKLVSSARYGVRLDLARSKATCGQARPQNSVHAHAGQPASSSRSTTITGRIARPMPKVRIG